MAAKKKRVSPPGVPKANAAAKQLLEAIVVDVNFSGVVLHEDAERIIAKALSTHIKRCDRVNPNTCDTIPSLDERFLAIAQHAVEEAERMECSLDAFVDGLSTIFIYVQDRLYAAEDELSHRRQSNADLVSRSADKLKDVE